MKLQQLRHIVLLTCAIFICSCSDKKSTDDSADLYSFNNDLVGVEVSDVDLGIKFSPPLDWELMPSSLSKKMEMRNSPSDGFIYQPVYVFFNNSNGAVLSCGIVTSTDSLASKNSELNFYKGLLTTKYKDSNFRLSNFLHSRISFNQIRFDKENLSAHRIFFKNISGKIIQLEYSVNKESITDELPKIKASIGTIRLLE